MQNPPESESFSTINFDWAYSIDTAPLLSLPQDREFWVALNPQRQNDCWLAHVGGKEFKILSTEVARKLLNEAVDCGLRIQGIHQPTGEMFYWQSAYPIKPLNLLSSLKAL